MNKFNDPLFYLGNPFTHPDESVMDSRLEKVTNAATQLYRLGIHSYAPISYNGVWSKRDPSLRTDWAFWEPFDKNFLKRCDALLVLTLDGWDISVGVKAEIEYASKKLRIPTFYISEENIVTSVVPHEITDWINWFVKMTQDKESFDESFIYDDYIA